MDILDIDDSVGAAQRNLSPKDLAALTIPLLPFSEQKRIAAIFDKADNLRSKRQEAIQLADEFLHCVFLDMFGDPEGEKTIQELLDEESLILHKDANHGTWIQL